MADASKQQLVVHFQTGIFRHTVNVDMGFTLNYVREQACMALGRAVSPITLATWPSCNFPNRSNLPKIPFPTDLPQKKKSFFSEKLFFLFF